MVNPEDRTEFVRLMVDRFSDDVYGRNNHEDVADYLYIINAPGQSGLEPEMLEFAKSHPDATVKELIDYFESMDPEIVDEDELEYVQLLRERYTPAEDAEYEEEADFLWMLNAPEQCYVQEEVLEYMKAHPEASLKDLIAFFDSLFPDGIPEEYQALDDEESQPCPVCGQHNFDESDDFEECPVCGWVNDGVQQADPDYPGGYNRISLNDARKKWEAGRKVWD